MAKIKEKMSAKIDRMVLETPNKTTTATPKKESHNLRIHTKQKIRDQIVIKEEIRIQCKKEITINNKKIINIEIILVERSAIYLNQIKTRITNMAPKMLGNLHIVLQVSRIWIQMTILEELKLWG